jgi:hypothetical protein
MGMQQGFVDCGLTVQMAWAGKLESTIRETEPTSVRIR